MTTTIHDDTTTTLYLNGTDQTWILAADASINIFTTNVGGISLYPGESNTLTINGTVAITSGSNVAAVNVNATNTIVNIGKTGVVSGFWGISHYGDGGVINNAGSIVAMGGRGIDLTFSGGTGEIHNSGYIFGSTGVFLATGVGLLINEAGGTIVGTQTGVLNYSTNGTTINHGTIKTTGYDDNFAVQLIDGDDRLQNDGKIYGRIVLGEGDDTFDNRGGYVDGRIDGDLGNDTLIVDKAKYKLTENAGEGDMDTVKSSVSYVLSDNVERLVLIGSKDIDGTGTALSDLLYGNSGNNVLKGLAGSDSLYGGKGNDRLTGGADADTFHFATGYGKDVITDFEQGIDTIDLSAWKAISSFKQVKSHAEDHGADVWISNGGDTLIIKHLHKADLTGGDFNFL